jgi:hypothetical protein
MRSNGLNTAPIGGSSWAETAAYGAMWPPRLVERKPSFSKTAVSAMRAAS